MFNYFYFENNDGVAPKSRHVIRKLRNLQCDWISASIHSDILIVCFIVVLILRLHEVSFVWIQSLLNELKDLFLFKLNRSA